MAKTKTTAKSPAKSPAKPGTVKLVDAANLLRLPPGVRDQKIPKGGKKARVVSIVDLPEAGFIGIVPDVITLSKDKFEGIKKYKLQAFDVLMSIQGTVGRVGIVPATFAGDWIANISLLAIRFKENKQDNAIALLEYLKSSHGKKIIAKLEKGSTIKRINVKEFAATQIPVISADIKRQSKALFDKEIKVVNTAEELLASLEELRKGYLAGK